MVACRSPAAPGAQPPEHGLGYLHTDGARLLSEDGAEQRIRAVSWFGMETETCAPHGLDEVSLDAVLSSIASMGFNTVRLPFSSACLTAATSTGVDPSLNPELAGAAPLQVMDLVVQRAAGHHLSVLLDRHRISSHQQSDLWYDASHSESDWIDDWTTLARRYADDATVIGADLHNEPHGAACWGCGDPSRDWAAAATRAGNAVLAVNPNWLIVVEGVEHQTVGESTWWGGGLADARHTPITLQQPHRVVYSPHAYPPSIFNQPQFTEAGFPDNLPAYWDRTWGYLQTENIAPVLLGEFGSKLATARDRAWMSTMVDYLNDTRMSFGYWSYNPDSVDTGGLVEKNWVTPERAKLTALAPLFLELPPAPQTAPPTASAPASTPAPPTPLSNHRTGAVGQPFTECESGAGPQLVVHRSRHPHGPVADPVVVGGRLCRQPGADRRRCADVRVAGQLAGRRRHVHPELLGSGMHSGPGTGRLSGQGLGSLDPGRCLRHGGSAGAQHRRKPHDTHPVGDPGALRWSGRVHCSLPICAVGVPMSSGGDGGHSSKSVNSEESHAQLASTRHLRRNPCRAGGRRPGDLGGRMR